MMGRFLHVCAVVRGSRGRSLSRLSGFWRATVPGRRLDFNVRIVDFQADDRAEP